MTTPCLSARAEAVSMCARVAGGMDEEKEWSGKEEDV